MNDGYLGSGTTLKSAFRKYGKHNFERSVIHYCVSEQDTYDWETIIVDNDFISRPNTYNRVRGGRMGVSLLGVEKTPEHRANISKSLTGREFSAEHCAKISIAATDRIHSPHSEETRSKISTSLSGRDINPEWREKLSKAQTGKKASEETKQAMRDAAKTHKPISEETRQRMSEAARKRKTSL